MNSLNNRAAEMAVLGSMMLDPTLDDPGLTVNTFQFADTQKLFRTILSMRVERGLTSDPLVVFNELQANGWAEEFGGHEAVAQFLATPAELASFPEYCRIIKTLHARRDAGMRLATLSRRIITEIDLPELQRELTTLSDDVGAFGGEEDAGRPFDWLNSHELDDGDFEVQYLIDQILVRQPGVIGGPLKSLKTGLSVDATISLAAGGWFLQKFKVLKPVNVALISGESGAATIQETARRVASAKGITLRSLKRAFWAFHLPTLGDAGSEAKLEKFIRDNEIEVVIIDPTYLAMPAGDSAGNLFAMGALLKGLTDIAQATKCTPLLNHHFRTAVPVGQTPELNMLSWSGLKEWTRQWLLLNRRTPYDPEVGGSHKLWLVTGGSAGHSGQYGLDIEEGTRDAPGGRFWEVKVMLPSEAKASCTTIDQQTKEDRQESIRQRKVQRDLDAILKALAKRPDGETQSALGKVCGMAAMRYAPAIELGVERGQLITCEVLKGKSKHPGFKVGPTTPTNSDSVRSSDSVGGMSDDSPIRESVGLPLFESDPFEEVA